MRFMFFMVEKKAATRVDGMEHGMGFIPPISPGQSSLAAAAGVPIFKIARVFPGALILKESNRVIYDHRLNMTLSIWLSMNGPDHALGLIIH